MGRKSRRVLLALILLVTGFIVTFSYQYASAKKNIPHSEEGLSQWKKEDQLRSKVLQQQELNHKLWQNIQLKREKINKIEEKLADRKQISYNLVEELKKFRTILGKEAVQGPGIVVTLSDSQYIPDGANPNNYIVHEQHVRAVVYELLVTGAEAIAINGQRISNFSYIKCVGPVIKVDGHKYPAPFVISAIGAPEKMYKSLFLPGNTVDRLVNQNIDVKVEKKQHLVIPPYYAQKGR
ncbi:MAG TPA: DUF881 domain-containing protein [Bacillales bacterium]